MAREMRAIHFFGFVALALLIAVFAPLPAHADWGQRQKESINYCHPMYSGIRKFYLSYHSDVPKDDTFNWEKVSEHLKRRYDRIFKESNVEFVFTELSPQEALNGSTTDLHVSIVYSFADRKSFTIPPSEDIIAIWLEQTKIHNDEALRAMEFIQKEDPQPWHTKPERIQTSKTGADLDSYDHTVGSLGPIDLSIAAQKHMDSIVCNVLYYTAGKRCSDPKNFEKQEINPAKKPCVPVP